MRNKKGSVLLALLAVLFFTVILSLLYTNIHAKASKFNKQIGENQITLLKTYERGETVLYYIDRSAELSIRDVIHTYAENGGYGKSDTDDCLSIDGYNYWYVSDNSQDKFCMPQNTKKDMQDKFTAGLLNYFNSFEEKIPAISYDFSNDESTFMGKAKQSLRMDVSDADVYNFKADSADYIYPAASAPPQQNTPPANPVTPPPVVTNLPTGTCSNIIAYADQFVHAQCPYWYNYPKNLDLTPQTCSQSGLTCATFVYNVMKIRGVYLSGNGGQMCSYNAGKVTMLGTDLRKLQPGDIFQAGGGVGHTGIYVGIGRLGGIEKTYFSIHHCFTVFVSDPVNGYPVFVHSIGNKDGGEPGACYEYYTDLFTPDMPHLTQFCRLKVCNTGQSV